MIRKKKYRREADYAAGARHSFETRREMDNFRQSFFKFIKKRGIALRGLFFNDPVGGYRVAIINPADVAGSQDALREYAALGNNYTAEIDGVFYENHRAAAAILGVSPDRLYDLVKKRKRIGVSVSEIVAKKAEAQRVKREKKANAAPRYMFDGLPFNSLPKAWAHFGLGRAKFKAAINDPRYPAMGVLAVSAARAADLQRKYVNKAAQYEKPIEIDGMLFKSQKEAMEHFGLTPHVFRRIIESRRFFEIGMAACLAEEAEAKIAAEARRAAEAERLAQWRAAQAAKPSKEELDAQRAARKKAIADEKAAKEKAIADAKAAKARAKADAEAARIAAAERMAQAIADHAARKQAKADAERARVEQAQREADQIAQARAARAERLKREAAEREAQRAADEAARIKALRKIGVK